MNNRTHLASEKGHIADIDRIVTRQSHIELAKRTIASYTILVIYAIFVLVTPYFRDHKLTVFLFAGLLIISLLFRIITARRLLSNLQTIPDSWVGQYWTATLIVGLVWAAFVWATYYHYSVDWIFLLLVISTNGIAAASANSLSPDGKLARLYAVCLVGAHHYHRILCGLTSVDNIERAYGNICCSVVCHYQGQPFAIEHKPKHHRAIEP